MGNRPWFPIAIEILLNGINKDMDITPIRDSSMFPAFPSSLSEDHPLNNKRSTDDSMKLNTISIDMKNTPMESTTTEENNTQKKENSSTLSLPRFTGIHNHIHSLFMSHDKTYSSLLASLTELAYSDKQIQY